MNHSHHTDPDVSISSVASRAAEEQPAEATPQQPMTISINIENPRVWLVGEPSVEAANGGVLVAAANQSLEQKVNCCSSLIVETQLLCTAQVNISRLSQNLPLNSIKLI